MYRIIIFLAIVVAITTMSCKSKSGERNRNNLNVNRSKIMKVQEVFQSSSGPVIIPGTEYELLTLDTMFAIGDIVKAGDSFYKIIQK